MSKKLYPFKDYIMVETLKPEQQETKSGLIVMPDNINTILQPLGVIHAVGEDIHDLRAGMKVLYSQHAGLKHSCEGKLFVFLKQHEIVATLV